MQLFKISKYKGTQSKGFKSSKSCEEQSISTPM
uniref:Uncharacterized protein n=1 Tax=Anguilla anguilla TaxID=7936 RepID=A0A0E9VIB6_ANGAN